MKRLPFTILSIIFLAITTLCNVAAAGTLQPANPQPRGVKPASIGFKNAIFADPAEDVQARYDWLKSSDRDAVMGAVTWNNRRTLYLIPGKYTRTATLNIDTDFVDIIGLGNQDDVIININSGTLQAVYQTARNVRLCNFRVNQDSLSGSNNWCLLINNELRNYQAAATVGGSGNLTLTRTGSGIGSMVVPFDPDGSSTNKWGVRPDEVYIWGGTTTPGWYQIESGSGDGVTLTDSPGASTGVNYAFCFQQSEYRNLSFFAKNHRCVKSTGHLGGLWEFCKSSGKLLQATNPTTGTFTCSVAGKEVTDETDGICSVTITPSDCNIATGDLIYFSDSNYAWKYRVTDVTDTKVKFRAPYVASTLTGTAGVLAAEVRPTARFLVGGGYSFGNDAARNVGGYFENCTATFGGFGGCEQVGCDVDATLVDCNGGDFSVASGCEFSGKLIRYRGGKGSVGGTSALVAASGHYPGYLHNAYIEDSYVWYDVNCTSFGQGNNARNGIKNSTILNSHIGSDSDSRAGTIRSGAYKSFQNSYIKDSHPVAQTAKTANFFINEFDNGQTFTNSGSHGSITAYLPPASKGLKYKIIDVVAGDGNDVTVDVNSTGDFIRRPDGTLQAGGASYANTENAYREMVFECSEPNIWQVITDIETFVPACVVTSQFDKTSDANLANIPGLSVNLIGGETYYFEARLFVTAGVTGQSKYAVSGNCTATSIVYDCVKVVTASANLIGRATALDTVEAITTTGSIQIQLFGTIITNAGGTLTIQFAQNASSANTSSVLVGSYLKVSKL